MRFDNLTLTELQTIFEGTFEPVPADETGLTSIKVSFLPHISLFKPHLPPKLYDDLIKDLIDFNAKPLSWWFLKFVKKALNDLEHLSQGNIRFDFFYRKLTSKDNVIIFLGCTTPEKISFHVNHGIKNIRLVCLNQEVPNILSDTGRFYVNILSDIGMFFVKYVTGSRALIEQLQLNIKILMKIIYHESLHALGLTHPAPEQQVGCYNTIMAYLKDFCKPYKECLSNGGDENDCRMKHGIFEPGPFDKLYVWLTYGKRNELLNYFMLIKQSVLKSGMYGISMAMLKNFIDLVNMALTKLMDYLSCEITFIRPIKLAIKMMLGMLMCAGTISNVYQLYKNYKLYVAFTYIFAPGVINKVASYFSKKYNTLSESVSFASISILISILQKPYPIAIEEIANFLSLFCSYYGTNKFIEIVVKKIQPVRAKKPKKQIKTQPAKTPTTIADLLKTHGLFRNYRFSNFDAVCTKLKEVEITEQNKNAIAQMIFNATHYYKNKILYQLLTCSFFCRNEAPVYCNTAALTT
jgi:hypothetical protein